MELGVGVPLGVGVGVEVPLGVGVGVEVPLGVGVGVGVTLGVGVGVGAGVGVGSGDTGIGCGPCTAGGTTTKRPLAVAFVAPPDCVAVTW